MADRFLIAPYDQRSGVQTDVKPWLIADNAFEKLNNVYQFRGRLRKRFGNKWLGPTQFNTRLRVKLGTTDGSGNFSGSVPVKTSGSPIVTPAVGQMFSIGTLTFNVTVAAAGSNNLLRSDGSGSTATFNTTTGAVVLNGATTTTDVYYYPSLPVMGLVTYDTDNINNEPTYAFDTRFAYQRSNGGWERLDGEASTGASYWSGSDSQFVWAANYSATNAYEKVLYVTNNNPNEYNATDHPGYMRYFDSSTNQWTYFSPIVDNTTSPNTVIQAARILVIFKNRLVALGTYEGQIGSTPEYYPFRMRASHTLSPVGATAWLQPPLGRGAALDAPTNEAIVSAEFVKDRLIVFFERSTYELAYTGNQVNPFAWQQINTELGAESTFSIVPFDRVTIGVGNLGIHACNGANVQRIDDKIPDTVFNIHNANAGVDRVYGIRDYETEMVYWTYPASDASSTYPYPRRILVYNYRTGTWAFFDDSITCFGYYQAQAGDSEADGVTWDSTTVTWDSDESWGGPGPVLAGQPQVRRVIAGNQTGWTFICDPQKTQNMPTLYFTNLTYATSSSGNKITVQSPNHNLRNGDFIYVDNIEDSGTIGTNLNMKIFKVVDDGDLTADQFTFYYSGDALTGTYRGNGYAARVSQIDIWTKQYNFYGQNGRNFAIEKVDFLVEATAAGKVTVDYFVSTNEASMVDDSDSNASKSNVGTNVLETSAYSSITYESRSTRLWHPVYFQADGEVIQLRLYLNEDQMSNVTIRNQDFSLHAMCFHAFPTAWRFQ